MPSSINPYEIDILVRRLTALGTDTITLGIDADRNETCKVVWNEIVVTGIALPQQIGGAIQDAERKLRAAIAQAHPEVELPPVVT